MPLYVHLFDGYKGKLLKVIVTNKIKKTHAPVWFKQFEQFQLYIVGIHCGTALVRYLITPFS